MASTVGRIPIIDVAPAVEDGRLPAKAVVGETFTIAATIFREGHDQLAAGVVLRDPAGADRPRVPLRLDVPGTDRWQADVTPDVAGDWSFTVHAWGDPLATWLHDAAIKVPAGIDVELMLAQGAHLLDRAAGALGAELTGERSVLVGAAATLRDPALPPGQRLAAADDREVHAVLAAHPLRQLASSSASYPLRVDRERALVGSWYEFFPRSIGAHRDDDTGRWVSGTLATATAHLDYVAAMGFDVVYLPPIHPIGRVDRKGANNTLHPGPDDPGSPWAIGSVEGGHDAVHPDLGTLADLDRFVARAGELGLEVALDYALQCAPDHPWASEHPEWFTRRIDGTIAYAENPPKKYQDIYPLNFDDDPEGLSKECLRVLRFWMDRGIRIFRVDNPHTKPLAFWAWLLAEVHSTDPDVVFLSEAFTRPPMMRMLAAVGFHQSYTYFTWRNQKAEIEDYLTELSRQTAHVLRPNFFVNTPDILHAFLQHGGPPAFAIRAALAATASPSWGVYSGFELFENVPLRPGSEEYLDSEKYQYRPRDFAGAQAAGASLAWFLTRLNEIRRAHPALRALRNLRLHRVHDPAMLAFSKATPDFADTVIVVLTLDPTGARESVASLDMPALGLDWADRVVVHDELTGQDWSWGEHNYVRLDPYAYPAHILSVRRGT